MTDTTELAVTSEVSAFSNAQAFDSAQRMAKMLASSSLVPPQFQGAENIGNCVIALEMAQRLGASPLAIMQNIYIVHGRPAWSAQYVIAALNTCGKFAPLRFKMAGEGDSRSCVAWTKDRTGETLDGPQVSIKMAKDDGWYGKNGSKWKTLPELMLRYRAATFFGRLYAPEIMMGMRTVDEMDDIIDLVPSSSGEYSEVKEPEAHTATRKESIKDKIRQSRQKDAAPPPQQETLGPSPAEVEQAIDTAETADDIALAMDLARSLPEGDERNRLVRKAQTRSLVL